MQRSIPKIKPPQKEFLEGGGERNSHDILQDEEKESQHQIQDVGSNPSIETKP